MASEQTQKLNAVREACGLRPDIRSDEHISDIMEFVQNVKFFGKLTMLQQRALCRTMTHETFSSREYIFQKGDFGDKFYIILLGSVSVHIDGVGTQSFEKRNLEKGMGFGEIALQCDQPRSATIITNERTETLVTKRADYEQYAGQLHRQFIQQRVRFLRQFPRIEDALQRCVVSTQDIAAMANCLNETSLSGGEMIVRQGDMVDNMIFVRKGQLAMLRLVDLDCPREADGKPCVLESRRRRTESQEEAQVSETSGSLAQDFTTKFVKMFAEQKQRSKEEKAKAEHFEEEHAADHDAAFHAVVIEPLGKERLAAIRMAALSNPGAGAGLCSPVGGPAGADGLMRQMTSGRGMLDRRAKTQTLGSVRGKELWQKVRGAFRQAVLVGSLSGGKGEQHESEDMGQRHLDNFMDVSAARRRFAEYRSKELQTQKRQGSSRTLAATRAQQIGRKETRDALDDPYGSTQSGTASGPSLQMSMSRGGRRKLLRIGTLGAVQYIGDRQVCNGEVYPVSLVSDPVADIYMMSKTDIQRRLPKKLFAALFTPDKETVPNDLQILEMYRQGERWQTFRRSMHGEAMAARQAQALRVPRPLRDPRSRSRVDPVANLSFLGVNPDAMPEALLAPVRRSAPLTARDEEMFSQSSAEFLRKFGHLRRDREVRHVLAQQGQADRHWDEADEEDTGDPMSFRFEQHWSKLGKFSMGLDNFADDDEHGEERRGRKSVVAVARNIERMKKAVNQVTAVSTFSKFGRKDKDQGEAARTSLKSGQGAGVELPPLSTPRSVRGSQGGVSAAAVSGSESARERRRTVNFH